MSLPATPGQEADVHRFHGSGRVLAAKAGANLQRVSVELGGHAPFIVYPDADPVHAAKGAAALKFLNSGQACISPNRLYVHRDHADAFIETMVPRVAKVKAGIGTAEGVGVGPLVNEAAVAKVAAQVDDARAKGAEVPVGGVRLTDDGLDAGHFYAPTVVTGVTDDMTIYREETFGPVAPIIVYDDVDQVIDLANDTNYGLAAYVYTNDLSTAIRAMEGLRFGIIGINDVNPTSAAAPFGGMNDSVWVVRVAERASPSISRPSSPVSRCKSVRVVCKSLHKHSTGRRVLSMHQVAIIGASGFTGAELLRICASHPELTVVAATGNTEAGNRVADLYPSLAAAYGEHDLRWQRRIGHRRCRSRLPRSAHGASQSMVPDLRGSVKHVVDLAADFRLDDPGLYPTWYGEAHAAPELLDDFVFGLPEFFRSDLAGAELIAAPGCYVTTSSLALGPLVKAGLIESTGIVVGGPAAWWRRPAAEAQHHLLCRRRGLHRLRPAASPAHARDRDGDRPPRRHRCPGALHPASRPMNRGILATCYARPAGSISTDDAMACLHAAYDDEPFVVVSERSPSTKATLGSNSCHITARVDERTGWLIVIAALDNLVKGASGQAVQCANLALGLPETTGLTVAGMYP